METRPYAPHDLDWLSDSQPAGWFDASGIPRLADPVLTVSFTHHGSYLGSSGLFKLWQGVYEAWLVLMVPPPDPWEFIQHMNRLVKLGQRLTKAHRLQAYCLADYRAGIVLARRLGFAQEAVLQAMTPQKTDMLIFAKVVR